MNDKELSECLLKIASGSYKAQEQLWFHFSNLSEQSRIQCIINCKDYFEFQSQLGNPFCQATLGRLYFAEIDALRRFRNYKQSLKCYHLAAQQNNPWAQSALGNFYLEGKARVIQNHVTAYQWYKLAAEQDNSFGQNGLGWIYEHGYAGVEKNYAEAAKWYWLSAEQENSFGQNNLGRMYQNGLGVKQDYIKAVKLFQRAAEQGNASAQSNLGWAYENGFGVSKDYSKAIVYYELAAKQKNSFAQNNLGRMYQNGLGVKQDYIKAMKLFQHAADQDDALAQNNLGWTYENGCGVNKDYAEAVKYYMLSAKQENSFGQNNLGRMYEQGLGDLPEDSSKAMELFTFSAEQGNAYGQFNLGRLYEKYQNLNIAVKYYILSARQMYQPAIDSLNRLKKARLIDQGLISSVQQRIQQDERRNSQNRTSVEQMVDDYKHRRAKKIILPFDFNKHPVTIGNTGEKIKNAFLSSDFISAVQRLNHLINTKPTAYAYFCRGYAYFQLNDYAEALADLNEAINLEGNNSEFFSFRATIFLKFGDFQAVVKDCDTAFNLNNKILMEETLKMRGIAKYFLNSYQEAYEDFSKIIQNNPFDAEALYFRGRSKLLIDESTSEEAYSDIARAVTINPKLIEQFEFLNKTPTPNLGRPKISRSPATLVSSTPFTFSQQRRKMFPSLEDKQPLLNQDDEEQGCQCLII